MRNTAPISCVTIIDAKADERIRREGWTVGVTVGSGGASVSLFLKKPFFGERLELQIKLDSGGTEENIGYVYLPGGNIYLTRDGSLIEVLDGVAAIAAHMSAGHRWEWDDEDWERPDSVGLGEYTGHFLVPVEEQKTPIAGDGLDYDGYPEGATGYRTAERGHYL